MKIKNYCEWKLKLQFRIIYILSIRTWLVKQCRPRPDTAFCGVWSGSTRLPFIQQYFRHNNRLWNGHVEKLGQVCGGDVEVVRNTWVTYGRIHSIWAGAHRFLHDGMRARAVWSDSSQSTMLVLKYPKRLQADNEDSDQPARTQAIEYEMLCPGSFHYENMPIQIYWKFYYQKMKVLR